MKEMIKEKAHNKAFAKIHALQIRVSKLTDEQKSKVRDIYDDFY